MEVCERDARRSMVAQTPAGLSDGNSLGKCEAGGARSGVGEALVDGNIPVGQLNRIVAGWKKSLPRRRRLEGSNHADSGVGP